LKSFDAAIVGGGSGGYVAALRGAQLGGRICLVERAEIGGTCLNRGCIPTKALLASAAVLRKTREARAYGVDIRGEIRPDLPAMMARKDRIVEIQRKGILALLKKGKVELIEGEARIEAPDRLSVRLNKGGLEEIRARSLIVATGSRPMELSGLSLDGESILSSTDALALRDVPASLLIVGAGYIGCEFACLFNALGSDVALVEMLERAIPMEEEESARILLREFRKRKIRFFFGRRLESAEHRGEGGVECMLSGGERLRVDKVLVCVGRAPVTEGLGLEDHGVEMGERGEIRVDECMETNIQGLYAAGDVTGGMLLAHVAAAEGEAAVENALGITRKFVESVVPSVIFTDPEVAGVGLTEAHAREKGMEVRTGRFLFRALGKAHAVGEIAGQVKLVAEAATDRLLGAHIVGPHAGEMIHEAALAIKAGVTAREVGGLIHAHPTLSEVLWEAAHDVNGEALHK
jgi:dihydrolipoamide dehydrogenase